MAVSFDGVITPGLSPDEPMTSMMALDYCAFQ